MKKLDELGVADNTIICVTTDNGAEYFSWPDGGMTPFAGTKGMVLENLQKAHPLPLVLESKIAVLGFEKLLLSLPQKTLQLVSFDRCDVPLQLDVTVYLEISGIGVLGMESSVPDHVLRAVNGNR